jgi:hypothetical protein
MRIVRRSAGCTQLLHGGLQRRHAVTNQVTMANIGDPEARFVVPVDGNRHTLRWVMAHMTSESARHAGHADLLREQLDGTAGR